MVNLIIAVVNENGLGISGIPIVCKVKNTNPIDPFAPTNYFQQMPDTNSSGISQSDNVQGYASFNCIANPNSQVSNYSSSSGTTSTTDLNNGNLTLTLKQIVSPIPTGANGNLACPSGYSLVNGQCIQGTMTESITESITNWISSHMIDFAIFSIALVAIAIIALKIPSFTNRLKPKIPSVIKFD